MMGGPRRRQPAGPAPAQSTPRAVVADYFATAGEANDWLEFDADTGLQERYAWQWPDTSAEWMQWRSEGDR